LYVLYVCIKLKHFYAAYLEGDGVDGEDDASEEPLVRQEAVQTPDILRGVTALVHQGVERRSERTNWGTPAGKHLVTGSVRDTLSVL
jgi:hypothetical protein